MDAICTELPLIVGGNRCGHNPTIPRFFKPPSQHKARAQILEKAKDNLKEYFAKPTKWLPDLCHVARSFRQRRSERRESIVLLSQVILHYVDIATLNIGIASDDKPFSHFTLEFLSNRAGLLLKRAQRALKDLIQGGYVILKRRFEYALKKGGSVKGLAAIKTLTPKFFTHLGIEYNNLVRHQNWVRKKREVNPYAIKRRAGLQPILDKLKSISTKNYSRKLIISVPVVQSQTHSQQHALAKLRAEQALKLHEQGFTLEEIKQKLYNTS